MALSHKVSSLEQGAVEFLKNSVEKEPKGCRLETLSGTCVHHGDVFEDGRDGPQLQHGQTELELVLHAVGVELLLHLGARELVQNLLQSVGDVRPQLRQHGVQPTHLRDTSRDTEPVEPVE